MSTLHTASLRYLLRHPAQLTLALVGLALGVATIVAVDIATASAQRAFELSIEAVNGAATEQIVGGPAGVDQTLYVRLRTHALEPDGPQPLYAPVLEGYVTVGGRTLELLGIDPFASAELEADSAPAGALALSAGDTGSLRRWFTVPGAVAMSAAAARELGVPPGGSFELRIAGNIYTATRVVTVADTVAASDTLLLTDIAQAQEWLGARGRLSRIDVRLPDDVAAAPLLARLRAQLPPGVELQSTRREARATFAMTGAFTTNLKALSLLALLVGILLIYGAVSFSVVQRRAIIGALRALGATRAQVLAAGAGRSRGARRRGRGLRRAARHCDRARARRPRLADHQRPVLRADGAGRRFPGRDLRRTVLGSGHRAGGSAAAGARGRLERAAARTGARSARATRMAARAAAGGAGRVPDRGGTVVLWLRAGASSADLPRCSCCCSGSRRRRRRRCAGWPGRVRASLGRSSPVVRLALTDVGLLEPHRGRRSQRSAWHSRR